jgi:hypothetical protein
MMATVLPVCRNSHRRTVMEGAARSSGETDALVHTGTKREPRTPRLFSNRFVNHTLISCGYGAGMDTHRIDIVGILKAFAIALAVTSASAAYAATLKEASIVQLLSSLHIIGTVTE